jgi:hypothetical protein
LVVLLVASMLMGCDATSHSSPDAGDGSVAMPDGSIGMPGDAGPVVDRTDPSTWVPPERPDLPPRPDWNPSYLPLGTAGWRNSTQALCNEDTGVIQGNQVWADDAGVYTWIYIDNDPLTAGHLANRPSGSALHFNAGDGWSELFWAPATAAGLGDLVSTSSNMILLDRFFCGIAQWDGTNVSCSLARVPNELFAMGESAYAIVGLELLTWSGMDWVLDRTLPDLGENAVPQALWTDGSRTLVAGRYQYVVEVVDDTVRDFSLDVPAGHYQAAWVSGAGKIWLGDEAGRLVTYDGAEWSTVETGIDTNCNQGIVELWGHGEVVYFLARTAFGRWTGTEVELLAAIECGGSDRAAFTDMWGFASDVYLTVLDAAFVDYECGDAFVVNYDGAEFHAF